MKLKIFNVLLQAFDLANDLRLHVLCNYFLIYSWFLYSSGVSVESSVECALVASSIAGVAYLLNRYTDYPYDIIVDKGLAKVRRNTYLYWSAIFLFFCLFFTYRNLDALTPSIFGLCFGILYSIKTVLAHPLKNYFLIKNFSAVAFKYISILWGLSLFTPISEDILLKSISMLVFLFVYEVLWDVRDMESDKAGGVATLPNKIGKDWALFICGVLCIVGYAVQYNFVSLTDYFFLKYIVAMLFIIGLFAIKNVGVRWYHAGIYLHIILRLFFINPEILDYISGVTNVSQPHASWVTTSLHQKASELQ